MVIYSGFVDSSNFCWFYRENWSFLMGEFGSGFCGGGAERVEFQGIRGVERKYVWRNHGSSGCVKHKYRKIYLQECKLEI